MSTHQGAFHRRVLPTPRFRRGSRGARHRSHGFAAAIRLPASVRPVRARRGTRVQTRLDPALLGAGQTPLVDFCNQTIREHDRSIVRTPISALGSCPPLARGPVEPKLTDAVDQVTPPRVVQPSLATRPYMKATPAEVSRARGLGLSPAGTPRRDCSRRELCPNPIGSDTSCREPVAPPAGEAGCVGYPYWTGTGDESTMGGAAFAVSP